LPGAVLKVELLGNARATEDVVAAPYPQLVESEGYQQLLGVGRGDVGDGPCQEAFEKRSWFHGTHGTHPV
jgi:hypothetical protein